MHSDWFFLGQDFARRTISMKTVIRERSLTVGGEGR